MNKGLEKCICGRPPELQFELTIDEAELGLLVCYNCGGLNFGALGQIFFDEKKQKLAFIKDDNMCIRAWNKGIRNIKERIMYEH